MADVVEFKRALQSDSLGEVADKFLLTGDAAHVSADQISIIRTRLSEVYKVSEDEIEVIIIGSAKLGFSIGCKIDPTDGIAKFFRPFNIESDIDVAVVSPPIFDKIWAELAVYAGSQPWFPLVYKKLGPYLVSGWLRPDHFPFGANLINCKKWFPTFLELSSDHRLGRRKVRGGLFNSLESLKQYQIRGLRECLSGGSV